MSSTCFSLWVINKAGGLIYQQTFNPALASLSSNDYLVLAGTFHGIHAITAKLAPTHPAGGGVETVEAEDFKMTCLQTFTGTKFVLTTSPSHPRPKVVLQMLYEAYADLLKDPFYTAENPIRNEGFDTRCREVCG